jgi:hypothetical protein
MNSPRSPEHGFAKALRRLFHLVNQRVSFSA